MSDLPTPESAPRPHDWFDPSSEFPNLTRGVESCRVCGVVRGPKSEAKACSGPVSMEPDDWFRDTQSEARPANVSDNRFARWDTGLLAERVEEIATRSPGVDVEDMLALLAAASRLRALYYDAPAAALSQTPGAKDPDRDSYGITMPLLQDDAERAPSAQAYHGIGLRHHREPVSASSSPALSETPGASDPPLTTPDRCKAHFMEAHARDDAKGMRRAFYALHELPRSMSETPATPAPLGQDWVSRVTSASAADVPIIGGAPAQPAPAQQRLGRDGVRLIRTGMADNVVLGDIAHAIQHSKLSIEELRRALAEHDARSSPPAPSETSDEIEALDDAIGTMEMEANDAEQKPRFRDAARRTLVGLRSLRAKLSSPPAPDAPHTCPVCNGGGDVSKPPHIAGDVTEWFSADANETYPCRACNGTGIVWRATPCPRLGACFASDCTCYPLASQSVAAEPLSVRSPSPDTP